MLEPGQRLNMRVIFTPVSHREQPYLQTIPIKITSNPRGKELTCQGHGDTPRIVFEPSVVDCGPILPMTPGQAPNEARVRLVNPCPFPVEVVSLDFDNQYKSEEGLLSALEDTRYNDHGVMFCEPRLPGAPLWPDIVQAAEARKALLAAQAQSEDAGQEEGAGVGELESAAPAAPQSAADTAAVAVAAADASSEETAAGPAPKLLVAVHGTTLSGVSTQARRLADRYQLPCMTLDELLFEAADMAVPEGVQVAPVAAEPAAAVPAGKARTPSTEPSKAPATDASAGPVWDGTISDQLYDKVFLDPELAKEPSYTPPHTKLAPTELQDLLLRGLKQAFAFSPALARGVVLDTMRCTYVDAATAMRLVLQGMGMTPVQPADTGDAKGKGKGAKPAAGGKGATPEPSGLGTPPDAWEGPHRVYMVLLSADKDVVLQRLTVRREQEEQAAAQAAEAARLAAAAAAPAADQDTPQAATEGNTDVLPADGASQPPVVSEAELQAEREAAAAALAQALDTEAQTALDTATQHLTALRDMAGKAPGTALSDGSTVQSNAVRVLEVLVTKDSTEEDLHLRCCGVDFRMGVRGCVLPEHPSDAHLIPPSFLMQVVARPRARAPRQPVARFRLLGVSDAPPESEQTEAVAATKGGAKGGKAPAGKGGKAGDEPAEVALNPLYKEETRWLLPPNSTKELVVLFQVRYAHAWTVAHTYTQWLLHAFVVNSEYLILGQAFAKHDACVV